MNIPYYYGKDVLVHWIYIKSLLSLYHDAAHIIHTAMLLQDWIVLPELFLAKKS
jgi:hypothetical protein